ncbi:MAG: acetyl-CoA acetyltransferase [Myxococcota bacterium]|nr:acetyl-CoA acetyltransferase [Myxococcota bacterium]
MTEDRRPVLVGVAQLVQRDVDFAELLSPLDMLERVALEAAEDAGVGRRLVDELDAVALVDGVGWRPKNAPSLLAERLGVKPRREWLAAIGGETPLVLVNRLARFIGSGHVRAALVAGTHNVRSLRRAQKARVKLEQPAGSGPDAERIGVNRRGSSVGEVEYGLSMPTDVYPIFENALRARRGLDLREHRARVGRLMSRFSEVAAKNPYAWFPVARSAEEIAEVAPDNRMVTYPYTKYMNAVMETDQAAAVILLSADAARELGVPESRWAYWRGGAEAIEEIWFPSERASFFESPAMQSAATAALEEASVEVGDITHFDFYSCFPVAVEVACEGLGLAEDDPRGFTVTGGLPYAGGPGNNYTLHSLATMVERVREESGASGLVTGNGWYLTKHAATAVASTPGEGLPAEAGPVALPEVPEGTASTEPVAGKARLLTYAVNFDRDGAPARGIVIGRTDEGRRFVANTPDDRTLLEDFVAREEVGREGRVRVEDGRNVFDPT